MSIDREPDVIITSVHEDEKIAAILICLDGGGTIRRLRRCASMYAPISEYMVKKIILRLQKLDIVYFDTKTRKWYLKNPLHFENFHNAVKYVHDNNIHLI